MEQDKGDEGGRMTTLQDVYDVYNKYLYLESTHLIDVSLATYITKDLPGKPLWMVPVGPSSYGKSTIASFIPYLEKTDKNKYRVLSMDQMTAKGFASTAISSKAPEYGKWLENQHSLMYFSDMASLLVSEDSKNLFAMFRTLYDGDIRLTTGTAERIYENCHVNMLGFSTPKIRSNLEHMTAMGTRELVYTLPKIQNPEGMYEKNVTKEVLKEISITVKDFIDELSIKTEQPNQEIKKYLSENAEHITIYRAEANDTESGMLFEPVETEYPKRVYDQLVKLWNGLTLMGLLEEKKKDIIIDISRGSGTKLRRLVLLEFFGVLVLKEDNTYHQYVNLDGGGKESTIRGVSNKLSIHPKEITREFSVLASLGLIRAKEEYPVPVDDGYGEKTIPENTWQSFSPNTKWFGVEPKKRKKIADMCL